jgi:hypothetical protein
MTSWIDPLDGPGCSPDLGMAGTRGPVARERPVPVDGRIPEVVTIRGDYKFSESLTTSTFAADANDHGVIAFTWHEPYNGSSGTACLGTSGGATTKNYPTSLQDYAYAQEHPKRSRHPANLC